MLSCSYHRSLQSHATVPGFLFLYSSCWNATIHGLPQPGCRCLGLPLASSTHSTYKTAERRYLNFYTSFHMISLPATEATLCYFVASLGQQGLAHSTICTYLSGVRQFQIAHGYKDLDFAQMPRLCQIIKGVKVRQGQEGGVAHPRLPITPTFNERSVVPL